MTTKHVDDPSASPTAIVVVVFTLLVVITILALQAYFSRVSNEQFEEKVVSEAPEEKTAVFAEQRKLLSEYRWVDREQGVVGIPVERAMELVTAELRQGGGELTFRLASVRSAAAGLVAAALAAAPASAQLLEDAPEQLEGVGITEKLDAPLPLELTFRDESGEPVTLGKYFGQGKPVALNLVYFSCPMLCNVFLDGFTATLRDLDWNPGQEFEIVTVSIDPRDTPEGATAKRAHYVEALGRPDAAPGWHFLTGSDDSIRRLADAVGFGYRFDEKTGEFMHSAGLFLSTPDGHLSRVLYGVFFEPQTLRLSLVEASDGRIGSPMDQVLLFCFAYDHTEGRYGPAAMKIMRAGGALTMLAVALFLVAYWKRDSRRRHGPTPGAGS